MPTNLELNRMVMKMQEEHDYLLHAMEKVEKTIKENEELHSKMKEMLHQIQISATEEMEDPVVILAKLKNIPAHRRGPHYQWQVDAARTSIGNRLNKELK